MMAGYQISIKAFAVGIREAFEQLLVCKVKSATRQTRRAAKQEDLDQYYGCPLVSAPSMAHFWGSESRGSHQLLANDLMGFWTLCSTPFPSSADRAPNLFSQTHR